MCDVKTTSPGPRARIALLLLALATPPQAPADQALDGELDRQLDRQLERCQTLEYSQPEEALALAEQILEQLEDRDEPLRRIRAIGCRGWAFAALGDKVQAERAALDILDLLPELDQPVDRIAALRRAAVLHQRSGRIRESIELLDRALVLADKSGLDGELAVLYSELGINHAQAENYATAVGHFERGLELAERSGNAGLGVMIRYNLGLALRSAGETERAYAILRDLIEPLQRPGLEVRLASLYAVLGSIARELGNLEQARDWLSRSAALHQGLDNPAEHSALLIDRATLALQQGDLAAASNWSEQALAEARRADYFPTLRGALRLRVDVLERLERPDEALGLLRELQRRSEEYTREQRNTELAQIEMRLGRETQARELAEARAEAQQRRLALEQQAARQRWVVFVAIVLLLAMVAAFAWQHANYRAVHRISRTDLLTGLRNRRGVTSLFATRGALPPEDATVLMLVDLDHFKQINDRYGHDSGDGVLREAARALQREAQAAAGSIGRWGGEEFLLLVPAADADQAAGLASRLLRRLRQLKPKDLGGRPIRITASIGFAPLSPVVLQSGQERWEPAFQIADQMLYRAKHAGRDRWAGIWPEARHQIDPHRVAAQIEAGEVRELEGS